MPSQLLVAIAEAHGQILKCRSTVTKIALKRPRSGADLTALDVTNLIAVAESFIAVADAVRAFAALDPSDEDLALLASPHAGFLEEQTEILNRNLLALSEEMRLLFDRGDDEILSSEFVSD
jgi:hypothetical protein